VFAEAVGEELLEYPVGIGNWFRGRWIDHPAQSNMYQVPEPLRTRCIESFLETRRRRAMRVPANYAEWLDAALGPVFARTFPAAYTRKYWTVDPDRLGLDWIGKRFFFPTEEEVLAGARAPLDRQTHYITHVRYPRRGGYQAFASRLAEGARIQMETEVVGIDLREKRVCTSDGRILAYERLVNTLPVPNFIDMCGNLPDAAREAARALDCSSVWLVEATAPHPTQRPEHWIYVYDEDLLSTRINCTERLSPCNALEGHTGVQVEVYFSRHRPLPCREGTLCDKVVDELTVMGLLCPDLCPNGSRDIRASVHRVPWANVIFTRETAAALETIWSALEPFGLRREPSDTHPLTDWSAAKPVPQDSVLVMAGRFGQWKYFWTDDCVLRGRAVGMRA